MSSRFSRVGTVVVLVAMVVGCGDDADRTERAAVSEGAAQDLPATPPPAPRPPPRPPRVVRVVGEGGPDLRVGAQVAHDVPIHSGGAHLVLDFPDGARIELGPHSVAAVGTEGAAEVFLGEGRVRASISVSGGSARPPLRIGTPAGTLSIEGAGDVVVAVGPGGRAAAAVLSGVASVGQGREGEGGRPVEEGLQAGQYAIVGDDGVRTRSGPSDLEAAWAQVEEGAEVSSESATEDRVAARRARRDELETCLGRLETLVARTDTLGAGAAGAEQVNRAAQRAEVVAHAQRLGRLRRVCRTRYERLRALELASDGEGGGGEPAPRDRVHGLLGIP